MVALLCCIARIVKLYNVGTHDLNLATEALTDTKGLGYKNIPIFLKSTCQVVIKQCTYSAVDMIEYI